MNTIISVFLETMGFEIIAAIIPTLLFVVLILYNVLWKGVTHLPKIVKTSQTLKVCGVSTMTSDETYVEDDFLLWKEFRRLKDKNLIFKKHGAGFSFALIKMMPKENEKNWEYFIGDIVPNFNNIPEGFKTIEVQPQTYVMLKSTFKRQVPWIHATLKIQKYLYEKWFPEAEYELNPDSPVKTIEYHNKTTNSKIRTILFYIAVRKKQKPAQTYS